MMPINEIIFNSAVLLARVAAAIGMILGVTLLFSASNILVLEEKMASRLSTQPLVDKLNERYLAVDRLLLDHPTVFGVCGVIASVTLIYVTTAYLLKG